MVAVFILGCALLVGGLMLVRWYGQASTAAMAQAVRTFIAVFSGLAGTGLMIAGRYGLAGVAVIATLLAIRSLLQHGRGADPLHEPGARDTASTVETALLAMRLDHATGEVRGTIKAGALAGRALESLSGDEPLMLLDEAIRLDAQSVPLVETWLDRIRPGWRAERTRESPGGGGGGGDGDGEMTPARAREILGVGSDAGEAEIRAAYHRLMAGLHPDRGGSTWLAAQINRARDVLLARRK